jgi:hypothetical protein
LGRGTEAMRMQEVPKGRELDFRCEWSMRAALLLGF